MIAGKRDIDGRLASAQTALMLQEETIRRNERERKQMLDKVNNLERNISAMEADRRQLEVRIARHRSRRINVGVSITYSWSR